MRIEWRISFEQKKTEVFGVIKLIANRQTSGHFSKIIDEIKGKIVTECLNIDGCCVWACEMNGRKNAHIRNMYKLE